MTTTMTPAPSTAPYPFCKACGSPAHVSAACPLIGSDEPVWKAPSGRWYITLGHAGFNSARNNADGYGSKAIAASVNRMYAARGTP